MLNKLIFSLCKEKILCSIQHMLRTLCLVIVLVLCSTRVAYGAEVTSLRGGAEQLTIATFNVENLDPKIEDITKVDRRSRRNVDDDVGSGKFSTLADQVVTNLKSPDIIALQEVQDNDGAELTSIVKADLTAETLISSIKSAAGPIYQYAEVPPQNGKDGGQPGGNIRVGYLYNPQRVNFLTAERFADDPAFVQSRKPLVGEFTFKAVPITLINNHFASKRGGAASDTQRVNQAKVVNRFVEDRLAADPDANLIVLGDLNDTPESLPITTLEGSILKNLSESIPTADRYSYIFRGNKELIDQILLTQNLMDQANPEVDAVHINAGVTGSASDHDPVIARFTLSGDQTPISNRPSPAVPPPPVPASNILADLSGDSLLTELDRLYSPRVALGYGSARRLLYTLIDNQGGVVTDLYTGYQAAIAKNSTQPNQDAAQKGINAEHVWPQSMGAQGAAKSDLHNLFASRSEVNSDRSNFPFAEIPDDQTTSWYLDDKELFVKPTANIDQYSEMKWGSFEPREVKKGDVARVIFYFRTLYPELADVSFFEQQRDTLCTWQTNDPIDASEVARSRAIALTLQGNENPFVLDPTLSQRTYCP